MVANGAELNARANVELVTVYEISKILSSSLDVTKTLREALNVLAHHLDFRRAMIALARGGHVWFESAKPGGAPRVSGCVCSRLRSRS